MSKGATITNDLLRLIYNATPIATIADNAAATPLTNIFVALHTAYPGESGTALTSEAAYGAYARQSVARTTGGWTVTGSSVSPFADITFPSATSGTETISFFSTCAALTGSAKIIHYGIFGVNLGPFTATAADVLTLPGLTGVAVNDQIAFRPAIGSTLPTGIVEGTVYFVKTVATNDITISTTAGGATLDITAVGDGIAFKVTPISVTTGVQPKITTATVIIED